MANSSPLFDPANGFTGTASGAAVVGSRILKVAAAKADGVPIPVAHCGASDAPIAVAEADAVQDAVVSCLPRQVQRIESAGTIAAGAAVEVTTGGKVQTYSSGRRCGVAIEAATNGTFPLILPQF